MPELSWLYGASTHVAVCDCGREFNANGRRRTFRKTLSDRLVQTAQECALCFEGRVLEVCSFSAILFRHGWGYVDA